MQKLLGRQSEQRLPLSLTRPRPPFWPSRVHRSVYTGNQWSGQINQLKTDFIGPLHWFPTATDRISRQCQKEDGSLYIRDGSEYSFACFAYCQGRLSQKENGSLYIWDGSEYGFACFAYCQGLCSFVFVVMFWLPWFTNGSYFPVNGTSVWHDFLMQRTLQDSKFLISGTSLQLTQICQLK